MPTLRRGENFERVTLEIDRLGDRRHLRARYGLQLKAVLRKRLLNARNIQSGEKPNSEKRRRENSDARMVTGSTGAGGRSITDCGRRVKGLRLRATRHRWQVWAMGCGPATAA